MPTKKKKPKQLLQPSSALSASALFLPCYRGAIKGKEKQTVTTLNTFSIEGVPRPAAIKEGTQLL